MGKSNDSQMVIVTRPKLAAMRKKMLKTFKILFLNIHGILYKT